MKLAACRSVSLWGPWKLWAAKASQVLRLEAGASRKSKTSQKTQEPAAADLVLSIQTGKVTPARGRGVVA